MAHAPEIRLPIKADTAPVIAVIDVVVKHLTALRDELTEMSGAPEGVRYWVEMATELLDDTEAMNAFRQAGLSVVELGGRVHRGSRMVVVEDLAAPRELDGKEVELSLRLDGDGPAVVVERKVIA